MTPTETASILRQFNEWRRAPSDGWREHPTSKEITNAINTAVEMIGRMENMKAALRQHHKNVMGEGLDPSHPLTKLRVSAYQQTNLYANTIASLEESK
jgi:hypothetical protein